MKLKYIEKHFVLTGSVQEMVVRGGKDVPKAAGFRYSAEGEQPLPKYALWWTDDPSIAVALVRYATDKAKAALHKMDDERGKAIESSRATSATLDVPAEVMDEENPIVFLQGDCREVLRKIEENSIDSVVTDPPYDLKFMGKEWDATGIAFQSEMWQEVLRVLKPGGHLIAMGGTRTHHRLWCAVEDAGFEIRDTLMWLYGTGFPKSLDVGKAIDKAAGAEREVVGKRTDGRYASGFSEQAKRAMGDIAHAESQGFAGEMGILTAPATDAARQWDGWGTALKPAWEPIVLARKPLIGTVAANVQEYGTGALNIDECRIDGAKRHPGDYDDGGAVGGGRTSGSYAGSDRATFNAEQGRWPANLVLDEDAAALLDAQSGELPGPWSSKGDTNAGRGGYGGWAKGPPENAKYHGDSGGASRFFLNVKPDEYCSLCALPMVPRHDTMSPCKNTDASNAAKPSQTIRATTAGIAPNNADTKPIERLAQDAQSVGKLCGLCATGIAQSIVAMQQGRVQESPHGWASISEHSERILTRCLASFVAHLGSTGTTPTTDSLSLFFGFVRDAMRSSIPTDAIASEQGQPSRLYYSSKASRKERGEGNNHPTVKPLALMRWLVRLITPPGGLVLDPFVGSGTTALAAKEEGFRCIGIDIGDEYLEIARRRCGLEEQSDD